MYSDRAIKSRDEIFEEHIPKFGEPSGDRLAVADAARRTRSSTT